MEGNLEWIELLLGKWESFEEYYFDWLRYDLMFNVFFSEECELIWKFR